MKEQIIKILKKHKGSDNAITVAKIADKISMIDTGLTNPRTRQMIKEIIYESELPIGSCSKGYYIIKTKEEFAANVGSLQGRIEGIQDRINNLVTAWINHLN